VAYCHAVLIFFQAPATTVIYTLSLHDALPISGALDREELGQVGHVGGLGQAAEDIRCGAGGRCGGGLIGGRSIVGCGGGERGGRSEEHTSELQSRSDLVCRLLLEKKKKRISYT